MANAKVSVHWQKHVATLPPLLSTSLRCQPLVTEQPEGQAQSSLEADHCISQAALARRKPSKACTVRWHPLSQGLMGLVCWQD